MSQCLVLTWIEFSGFSFVTLGHYKETVLAGSWGHLYGIDPTSGKVTFKDSLSGMGNDHLTISSIYGSTDLSSSTFPHMIEEQRKNKK
jgi:hypothetical protein